ncbi:Non-specific lipid-transfer protein Cor a 8.0101 [Linum grandiflorum]
MAVLKMMMSSLLFVSILVVSAPIRPTNGAITCMQVMGSLSPCIYYLVGGGEVSAPCCDGVRALNNAAVTTVDRRQACQCLKNAAAGVPGLQAPLARSLPGKCGVHVPYEISPDTNCNSVQ